jgi:2'-5' RNA ligase
LEKGEQVMQYFIGVVPPDDYKRKLISFQERWKNNSLVKVVEPHITVKAQSGLTMDKSWLGNVKAVGESFSPFEVTLNQPMFFGEHVLFLSVLSNKINDLHRRLVDAVSPDQELIKKYMELEDYTPHLTLGQTFWGLTYPELKEMADMTEKKLLPYPTFEVQFIRIYQEIEPNRYIKYLDIPLGS